MDYNEDTDTCQLNAASNVTYKLPNSAIDICLIYGIDENTDRCLKPLNFTEKLQSDSSALQQVLEKLHGYEVEPYSLAVINATLTHFPHFSSGSLDDSIMSMDTNVDDKALGISWDVVKTVQKFFFPDGTRIEVTDEQPLASTMSTVLTDIDGRRTYCTGLRFYRPFTVKEHENQTFALNACSRKDSPPGTKLVYVPSCAVFQSSVPCYNLQKELLSCLLHNLAQKDDLKFWDVLQKFVKKLFWIPVPPPGRLCTEFSVGDYCGSICPPLSEYVNLDIRLNYPFLSLSIDSVLEVVGALLMEQRIVFVSTSYTLLTYNMECFLRFISPFEWRSTYVPVLPSEMMGLLDAPGSFLYGCHSDCIDEEILSTVEELVIVNLDNDEVQQLNYESNLPKMPQSVCDNFKQSYKKLKVWYELEESDRPMPLPAAALVQHRHEFERRYDSYLLDIFLNMMVELFGEVTYYLCSGNLRYEESPTYQSACKETKEFYKLALSTDLFSLLLQNRNTKTTRDSFTLISDKKRRDKRMLEMCDTTITDTTAAATTGKPIKQRSEEQDTPKAPSSLVRLYSQQPPNSPKESPDTLHMTKRTSSLKQPIPPLLPEQPKRLLPHSTSGSDLETAADSLAVLCSCDPSTYCKVKLPSLRDEVSPKEVFEDLIAQLTEVIKESATTKGKMAPALYLRACVYIAKGQHDKGFCDFATLDKHSVQLMPNQRTLESIMAPLPKDVIAGLKGKPFWPLFTRRLREYSRQSSYRVTDLRHKLPIKPLRNELFLRTMQKNNIISDGDSAGRLYELLTDNKPAVSVEDLESFYESWRSVTDDNQSTDLHTELLQMEIMGFKHSEKVLATVTSSQLKTSFGSGHVILTTCRLLLRNSLKISTICDLTSNVKVERHEDINVLGVGQPMITFGTEAGTSSTSSIKSQASSITKSQAISSTRHHLSAPRFPRATRRIKQPYILFHDKSTREIWLKMIKEMETGLLMAKTKKDANIIQQAETNIIVLNAILNSNLNCKDVVKKSPNKLLYYCTKDVASGSQPNVAIEKSLIVRINPSINQTSKATIECSLYVPPDNGNSTGGRLWLGLGTGLLRVYDMDHYYLESDTKITDCTQKTSTRLSSFLLVDNFVWAGSLNRTIYILDSDTSTVVSKLSNLEDDPSVLAIGKLEHQKVVWSLLIQGLLIAWNPLTRERELTIALPVSNLPKSHPFICYSMAVLEDHLWIGTNLDMMLVLRIENDKKWSVVKEVSVGNTGKNESQVKCVAVSNNGLIWCSTKIPNQLTVFDAKTFKKRYTFENKEETNKPVNVILPVNNQIWCGTKSGKILIFEDEEIKEKELKPLKIVNAHEDTIRTLLLLKKDDKSHSRVISGSGSRDGCAAVWNPLLI